MGSNPILQPTPERTTLTKHTMKHEFKMLIVAVVATALLILGVSTVFAEERPMDIFEIQQTQLDLKTKMDEIHLANEDLRKELDDMPERHQQERDALYLKQQQEMIDTNMEISTNRLLWGDYKAELNEMDINEREWKAANENPSFR